VSSVSIDCNARNSDDSFEFLNPSLYIPETCSTGSERNDRTLEAEQVSVNCDLSVLKSRISEGLDSRTNIFATERFTVLHAYK